MGSECMLVLHYNSLLLIYAFAQRADFRREVIYPLGVANTLDHAR